MTLLQRIHYVWVRAGLALLVLMPLAMYVMFRPWNVDAAVWQNSDGVRVSIEDAGLVLEPMVDRGPGLLVLPGCPVDPRAYAPLARRIADAGHLAVVLRIPYRCAPTPALERALDDRLASLLVRWPDRRFVLAGHSRGGAHTARIAASGKLRFAGYVLMGTSHPRDHDLSRMTAPLTKIAGTRDGVAGEAQFQTHLLPSSTTWVRIEGGNHSQFANYGFQLFDKRAQISREAQQSQIVSALLAALARVASR
jgi:pimeloyl-ACP methyl ester carboxylesterase